MLLKQNNSLFKEMHLAVETAFTDKQTKPTASRLSYG